MNKKYVLALSLAVLVTGIVFSQDSKQQKVFFGVGVGGNLSFFNTGVSAYGDKKNDEFKGHFRLSPSIYTTVRYMLNNYSFLKTGLMFNFRGGAYIADDNNVIVTSNKGSSKGKKHRRFLLNYVEIPLMVGYNVRKIFDKENYENRKPINIAAGLTGAFNVSSKFKANYYKQKGSGSGPMVEVKEDFKSFDFDHANSFLMNAIVEISFLSDNIGGVNSEVTVRYNQSLGNVYNVKQLNGYNFETTMGTITLGITMEFLN